MHHFFIYYIPVIYGLTNLFIIYFFQLKQPHNDQYSILVSVVDRMSYRQKIYIGLAVSAGVFTSIGLYLLYRHQRLLKANRPITPTSILSSLKSRRDRDYQYVDRYSSSEIDNDESESIHISSN